MPCNEHCEEGEGRYSECSLQATRRSLRTVAHWLVVAFAVALVAALVLSLAWLLLGGLVAGINI